MKKAGKIKLKTLKREKVSKIPIKTSFNCSLVSPLDFLVLTHKLVIALITKNSTSPAKIAIPGAFSIFNIFPFSEISMTFSKTRGVRVRIDVTKVSGIITNL